MADMQSCLLCRRGKLHVFQQCWTSGFLRRSRLLGFFGQNNPFPGDDCKPVLARVDGRAAHYSYGELAGKSTIDGSCFQDEDAGNQKLLDTKGTVGGSAG